MKTKKSSSIVLQESQGKYNADPEPDAMVRTQIYLTRAEHEFVQKEAERIGKPMAAVIRGFIDDNMTITEEEWANNPLLQPPAGETDFVGREDGAINHDHYIYGGPKKFEKVNGEWVPLPMLP